MLRIGIIASTTALAGCLTSGGSQDAEPTPPENCSTAPKPKPTPTNEGLEPKNFPNYPDNLNKESAKKFSIEFERSYQYNDFLANYFIKGTDEIDMNIGVANGGIKEKPDGYIITVRGELKTSDTRSPENESSPSPTDTQAPSLDAPFVSNYYLNEQFGLRKPGTPTQPTKTKQDIKFEGASVIACSGN